MNTFMVEEVYLTGFDCFFVRNTYNRKWSNTSFALVHIFSTFVTINTINCFINQEMLCVLGECLVNDCWLEMYKRD